MSYHLGRLQVPLASRTLAFVTQGRYASLIEIPSGASGNKFTPVVGPDWVSITGWASRIFLNTWRDPAVSRLKGYVKIGRRLR